MGYSARLPALNVSKPVFVLVGLAGRTQKGSWRERRGHRGKIANEIMFAFDSDQLRPNASNILAECAELIKREHAKHVRSSVTRTPWGAWTITSSSRSVALRP
jgi:hypothetical protein